MSLIDDLRDAAGAVPPSHVPTAHELPGVLGALILHLEHGDFLAAAGDGVQGVTDLISPPPPEGQAPAGSDQATQIAALQAQVAALQGAAGHPTITVEPPVDTPPAPSEPLPAPTPPADPSQGPA